VQTKGAGAVVGNQLQAIVNLLIAHQLTNMQPHMQHLQHIAGTQRVPRVENIIVTETNVNARRHQLLHPGDAAALWIVVKAPLEMNIHQRVGDKVDSRELQ
jgi:hypothetical protein